jgi:hypothetical protein
VLDGGREEEIEGRLRGGREVRRKRSVGVFAEGVKGTRKEVEVRRDGETIARLGRGEVVELPALLGGRNEGGRELERVAETAIDVGVVT